MLTIKSKNYNLKKTGVISSNTNMRILLLEDDVKLGPRNAMGKIQKNSILNLIT